MQYGFHKHINFVTDQPSEGDRKSLIDAYHKGITSHVHVHSSHSS